MVIGETGTTRQLVAGETTRKLPLEVHQAREMPALVVIPGPPPRPETAYPEAKIATVTAPESEITQIDIPKLIAEARETVRQRKSDGLVGSEAPSVTATEDTTSTREFPAFVEITFVKPLLDQIRGILITALSINEAVTDEVLAQMIAKTVEHHQVLAQFDAISSEDSLELATKQLAELTHQQEAFEAAQTNVLASETSEELEVAFQQFGSLHTLFAIKATGVKIPDELQQTSGERFYWNQLSQNLEKINNTRELVFVTVSNQYRQLSDLMNKLATATTFEELNTAITVDALSLLKHVAAALKGRNDKVNLFNRNEVAEVIKVVLRYGDKWWQREGFDKGNKDYLWSSLPKYLSIPLKKLVDAHLNAERSNREQGFHALMDDGVSLDALIQGLKGLDWYTHEDSERTCDKLAEKVGEFMQSPVFTGVGENIVVVPKWLDFQPLRGKLEALLRKSDAFHQLLLIDQKEESLKDFDTLIQALIVIGSQFILPGTETTAGQLAIELIAVRRDWMTNAVTSVTTGPFWSRNTMYQNKSKEELAKLIPQDTALKGLESRKLGSLPIRTLILNAFVAFPPEKATQNQSSSVELLGEGLIILRSASVMLGGPNPDFRLLDEKGNDMLGSLHINLGSLAGTAKGYPIRLVKSGNVTILKNGLQKTVTLNALNREDNLQSGDVISLSNVKLEYKKFSGTHTLRILPQPGAGKVVASLPKAS